MLWLIGIILIILAIFLFGGGYVIKQVEKEDTDPIHKEKMKHFRENHLWKLELAIKIFNWSVVLFILYCIVTGTYYTREG